ncbi:MAG TPA: CoA transferase [Steroidobacteraceae bacterium]|nr:CoA transferase [Steroidobacteraceae bacterium]
MPETVAGADRFEGRQTPGRLPLAGVRVLDLSDEAVALAARLLADLGAEVIRAESASGDYLRRRGPFLGGRSDLERGLAHLLYNAGKQSLALALELPESWELLDRLLDHIDAVIAPLEKTALARRFFDAERLRAVHARACVVDIALRPGSSRGAATDLIGVAAGGLLYLNGFAEDPPNVPAGKLAYKQTSLAAALAAMSLLMRGRRTGQGGRITVSMQEAVTWTTMQTANENYWHWHHARPKRTGAEGLGRSGSRSIFQCKDGLWVSFSIHPPYWNRFVDWTVEVTGDNELRGVEWSEPRRRWERGDIIAAFTEQIASRLTRDEMLREGQKHGVLIGPVHGVAEIAHDQQLLARGLFREVSHPQFGRSLTMLQPPFFSSAYRVEMRAAPMLGQHSREILRGRLELDDAEIDALVACRTVSEPSRPPASLGTA